MGHPGAPYHYVRTQSVEGDPAQPWLMVGGEGHNIAAGDSGQGMTHGTIAGILISDLVLGRPNAWEELQTRSTGIPG